MKGGFGKRVPRHHVLDIGGGTSKAQTGWRENRDGEARQSSARIRRSMRGRKEGREQHEARMRRK